MRNCPKLDHLARGDVFTQLGYMLNAGLPLDRALATLATGTEDAAKIASAMLPMVKSGESLTVSGTRTGLIEPLDREFLRSAEMSGRVGPALGRLGQWHSAKAARARRIKSKLTLPIAVLVLAAFVAPLPGLFGGSISVFTYLVGVLWFLGRAAAVGWALWHLPGWLRERGRAAWLDRLRIELPIMGVMHVRNEVLSVLDAFEMLYSAGVDSDRALTVASDSTVNDYIYQSFVDTRARLKNGMTLGDAFAANEYLTHRTRQLIITGDSSGSLTDTLQRNSTLERGDIELFDAQVAEWIPRLVYGVVASWMISNIL